MQPTSSFFREKRSLVLIESVSVCWEVFSIVGVLRPNDNIGLVPEDSHIRMIEYFDWYALATGISA